MNKNIVKPAIGAVFGAALVLAVTASAQQKSGNWFSEAFSTGGSGTMPPDKTLLAQADAAMNAQIQNDLQNCDDVGIGASIKTAIAAQMQMASATPQIESLFDPNANCFSGVSQMIDLSFSIPSLGSILSAAENAVLQYAQKKVCSAVNQMTSIVTSPINQAIGTWNGLGTKFTDISGMGTSSIGGAMGQIDPQLGAAYHATSNEQTYTVSNPFSNSQTTFQAVNTTTTQVQTSIVSVQQQAVQKSTQPTSTDWWSSVSNLFN